jgi:hypothetical protein
MKQSYHVNRTVFISVSVGRAEFWNKSLERTRIQRVMVVLRVQYSVLIMKENENYYVSFVASYYLKSQSYRKEAKRVY